MSSSLDTNWDSCTWPQRYMISSMELNYILVNNKRLFDTDNHRFETIQEKEERVLRNCGSKPKFWEISKKRQYRTCRAKEMWDKKYMLRPLLKKKRSRRRR